MNIAARRWLVAIGLLLALPSAAAAEPLAGNVLVQALRQGGFVIYFRHAATDWSQQDRVNAAGEWTSCEPDRMRQLSEEGRKTAERIGTSMRRLSIPVSRVLSSEYCRTRETALRLGLGLVETTPDIMNMKVADFVGGRDAVIQRARKRLSEPTPPGANVVIVGHGNVVLAATGAYPAEAGAAVFRPRAGEAPELIAEVAPAEWTDVARRLDPLE
ncbi:MAG: histidine phosphatase family protein [Rhodospirillales bacterium]|nr:histidine phosphatase family protein [Rhodospirillales bacterium]